MNFAGRFKDREVVEGWNFDQVYYFSKGTTDGRKGEKENTLTVEFMGGNKVTFTGLEANIVYAHLCKTVFLTVNVPSYDWRKEIQKDQQKAQEELKELASRTDAAGRVTGKKPLSTASGL